MKVWLVLVAGCAQQFGLKPLPPADGAADVVLQDALPGGAWQKVGTGATLACGLTSNDHVLCWTPGTAGPPTPIGDPAMTWTDLSVGAHHACAVSQGHAYCWGQNDVGQADPTSVGTKVSVPTRVDLLATAPPVDRVVAGGFHSCALTLNDVYCWGNSQQTGGVQNGPNPIAAGTAFRALSAGYDHTCGVTTSGAVYCWGGDSHGESSGSTSPPASQLVPVQVPLPSSVSAVGAGFLATCAVVANNSAGQIDCWGDELVPLADTTQGTIAPTTVTEAGPWTDVAMGGHAMCALTADHAECWGVVMNGGLGDGKLTETVAPTGTRVRHSVTQVAFELSNENGEHAVATASGAATYWGPPAMPSAFPAPP